MSRFGAFETSGFAIVNGITLFTEKVNVAPGLLLSYNPSLYPAAVVAQLNPEKMPTSAPTAMGHAWRRFKCKLGILIHANSDGVQLGDAHIPAMTLVDAVMEAFSTPAWVPTGIDGTPYPCEIEAPMNVMTDTGRNAVYLEVTAEIEWRT